MKSVAEGPLWSANHIQKAESHSGHLHSIEHSNRCNPSHISFYCSGASCLIFTRVVTCMLLTLHINIATIVTHLALYLCLLFWLQLNNFCLFSAITRSLPLFGRNGVVGVSAIVWLLLFYLLASDKNTSIHFTPLTLSANYPGISLLCPWGENLAPALS